MNGLVSAAAEAEVIRTHFIDILSIFNSNIQGFIF